MSPTGHVYICLIFLFFIHILYFCDGVHAGGVVQIAKDIAGVDDCKGVLV
jgi:hypothetical protein